MRVSTQRWIYVFVQVVEQVVVVALIELQGLIGRAGLLVEVLATAFTLKEHRGSDTCSAADRQQPPAGFGEKSVLLVMTPERLRFLSQPC
jgi:hypothetical protein